MEVLFKLVQIISSMVAVLGLLIFPRLTKTLRIFVIYLTISSCTEMLSYIFATQGYKNLYFFHTFTLLEFWFVTIFFLRAIDTLKRKLPLMPVLMGGVSIIAVNTFVIQGLHVFNSYSATFVSVLIICLCLIYFYYLLENSVTNVESNTIKWLVIAIFINHCISLMVLIFSNQLLNFSRDTQDFIWGFRTVIILCTKLIFFFSLLYYTFYDIKSVVSQENRLI